MAEQLKQNRSGASGPGPASTESDKRQESARKASEKVPAEKRSSSGNHDRGAAAERPREPSPPWQEPRGIQKGIADADKIARSGSTEETVRDTPPAGAWNDTSAD